MDWRENGNGELKILDGRRYMYKGVKRGVAIEGNFSAMNSSWRDSFGSRWDLTRARLKPES